MKGTRGWQISMSVPQMRLSGRPILSPKLLNPHACPTICREFKNRLAEGCVAPVISIWSVLYPVDICTVRDDEIVACATFISPQDPSERLLLINLHTEILPSFPLEQPQRLDQSIHVGNAGVHRHDLFVEGVGGLASLLHLLTGELVGVIAY